MAKRKTKSTETSASAKKSPEKTPSQKKTVQKSASRKKITGENLNYIDGKYDVKQIKQLEELVGIREVSPYKTTSLEVLEARVSEMNMWELQEFAVKVGVFPSGTRTALKNKLFKEFKNYNQGKGRHIVVPAAQSVGGHLTKEELNKVLDLTKRGL